MEQGDPRIASWLTALAELGAAVNAGIALRELLTAVARAACELMGYDFCAVALPDDARQVLRFEGWHGLSPAYIEEVNSAHPIRISPDATAPSGRAFLGGVPVQIDDTSTHPAFESWSGVARSQGFASIVSMPLIASGEVLGTLNGYTRRRHLFDADLPLLAMLADQAAISITAARLREQQARSISRLNAANLSLAEQHELQRRAAEIHDRLTAVSLAGGGVPALADTLAQLLGRAVAVLAADVRPLHVTDGWRDGAQGGEVLRTPVALQGEIVATILVSGTRVELSPIDVRAIEHTATVLALEILRQRAAAEAEWRRSDEFLAALLGDDVHDPAALLDRARTFGHDPGGTPHVLLVFRISGGESISTHRLAEAFRQLARSVLPRPVLGVHRGYLIVLWPDDDGTSLPEVIEATRRACGIARGTTGVLTAVVGPASTPGDYRRAFRTGRGIVELAAMRGAVDADIRPEELGLSGLLLRYDDPAELRSEVERVLGPLRAHDERTGSELLATLQALLRHDLHASDAAEELFVHKNTVAQRRSRIEELMQRRLNHVWDLAEVAMAVRIDEVIAARMDAPRAGEARRASASRPAAVDEQ